MSKKYKLFRIILYPYVFLVPAVLIIGFFLIRNFDFYLRNQSAENLKARAELFGSSVGIRFSVANADSIQTLCENLGSIVLTRFTVILPDGVVIGDSETNYRLMDNHGDRPEFLDALTGKTGTSIRYSYTEEMKFIFVAVPVVKNDEVIAVIRASIPSSSVENIIHTIYDKFYTLIFIFLIISLAVAFFLNRWIKSRLREIIYGAERFKTGNLDYHLPDSKYEEFGRVSEAFNLMAAEIDEKFRAISNRRDELEAIFKGMTEAVIAVDSEAKIIEYNHAAEELLKVSLEGAKGKYIQEAVLNANLQRFIRRTLETKELAEDEITIILGNEEKNLQAHGTRIVSPDGKVKGAVIVLSDISRIKKLEIIRRDFVANVSHELKTPITSILGFVETLKDGAIEDVENRGQFLNIIHGHAERLNGIIDDLLSLSRIEQDQERGKILFEYGNLCEIITNAVTFCEPKARDKNISITYECPEIIIKCNQTLLEQALINLIDNSVKYSDPGASVEIEVIKNEQEISIKVRDTGWGISAEHHERIFERFYRVDKGRSRTLGGTGLGLSIVKHIVISHGGRIEVESSPGKGSTFTIILPA